MPVSCTAVVIVACGLVLAGCESAEVQELREAETQAASLEETCRSMSDLSAQLDSATGLAGEPKRDNETRRFAKTACELADEAKMKADRLDVAFRAGR